MKWNKNDVITVKLNCDNWEVTYYKNGIGFKWDIVDPYESYFFVMFCCGYSIPDMQVVENPDLYE